MPEVKVALNTPHVKGWLEPIGKFVLNFAAIEMHTYLWLGDHAANEDVLPGAVDWPFKRRVEKVLSVLDSKIADEALRSQCANAWSRALELARFRNAILHNPIVFGWSKGVEEGAPDLIGIPDIGHLGPRPKLSQKVASLSDINDRVNETAALANNLFSLRARCQPTI